MKRRVVTVTVATIVLLATALPLIAFPVHSQVPTLSIKPVVIPQKLPADSGTYPAIFIQLASPSGNTVEAPQSYQLFLTSSNQTVGSATSPLTINPGQTYGTDFFKTTGAAGTTSVTISGNGLSPISVQVTTYAPTSAPSKLVVFVAPSTLVADGTSSYYLFVQLEDGSGNPSRTSQPLTIVTTSSDTQVLNVPPTMQIPTGTTFALSQVTAGSVPGNATITAQLNGFQSAAATVKSSILPVSLSMTNNGGGNIVTGSSVTFTLSASSSGVPIGGASVAWNVTSKAGTFTNSSKATDATGSAVATLKFTTGGNATVTATVSAAGYGSKSISQTLAVKSLVLAVQLIPTSLAVNASQTSSVTAVVTSSGKPVSGASISWSITAGSFNPTASTTDSSGTATSSFKAGANGNATITATASAPGYQGGTGTVVITVGQSGGGSGSASSGFSATTIALIAGVVVILALLFVFRKRLPLPGMKGGKGETEEEEESQENEELTPEEPTVDALRTILERSSANE